MCSECGLDFQCSRALSPRLIGPRWSYEHGYLRESVRWRMSSYVAVLPQKLFRELAVDHRVNAQRLVRFALVWAAAIHLSTAAVVTGFMFISMGGMAGMAMYRFENGFWVFALKCLLLPYAGELYIQTGPTTSIHVPLLPLFLLVYIPTLLMPAWAMILGTSLRLARVRKVHLLRGLAYALPCAAMYLAVCIATMAGMPLARSYLGLTAPPMLLGGVMLLCAGHHLAWWYLFIRRYLRLRHAAAVVILNTVMNVLVVMIAIVMLSFLGMRF
jgi:hypothetical protein